MKVYEAIADILIREDVDVVFTLIDDSIAPVAQELHDKGVRIVSARHEQSVVAMADGYARASGRMAVCAIGAGPALAQTGTALITARRKGSPLLVLAGDTAWNQRHHTKRFDQAAFVRVTAGACYPLQHPAGTAATLGQALGHVRAGGGPAVVVLPSDLVDSDLPGAWAYTPHPAVSSTVLPDPAAVERAAVLLGAAKRPILLAGRGAVTSGARESIEKLARRTGALLATTLQARDWFRGHSSNIGMMGSFATPRARELFGQADVLVAIGTTLNPYVQGTAYELSVLAAGKTAIIQIDRDADRINDYCPVELGVVGDAKASVDAILDRLGAARTAGEARSWHDEPGAAAIPSPRRTAPSGAPPVFDFLGALDPLLPEARTVVVDCGAFIASVVDQIRCPPESFLWTMDFGSVGLALPMGIGAAVARPDRPCFVFVGDGGFTMSPQELISATAHEVPLTVVVLDDGGYGAEAHILTRRDKAPDLALLKNPDLAQVARSLGAEAVTVRSAADLSGIDCLVAAKRTRPLVIHALVQRDEGHRAVP